MANAEEDCRPAYFKWQWRWSPDNSLMVESHRRFTTDQACREEAHRCKPHYTTYDGIGAPAAMLVIDGFSSKDEKLEKYWTPPDFDGKWRPAGDWKTRYYGAYDPTMSGGIYTYDANRNPPVLDTSGKGKYSFGEKSKPFPGSLTLTGRALSDRSSCSSSLASSGGFGSGLVIDTSPPRKHPAPSDHTSPSGSSDSTNAQFEYRELFRLPLEGTDILVRGIVITNPATPDQKTTKVDIRRWTKGDNSTESFATKRGIAMDVKSWVSLLSRQHEVGHKLQMIKDGQAVSEKMHVNEGDYVSVASPFWTVNLRRWFRSEDGSLRPTKKGIMLKFREWESLINIASQVKMVLPEVSRQQYHVCSAQCRELIVVE